MPQFHVLWIGPSISCSAFSCPLFSAPPPISTARYRDNVYMSLRRWVHLNEMTPFCFTLAYKVTCLIFVFRQVIYNSARKHFFLLTSKLRTACRLAGNTVTLKALTAMSLSPRSCVFWQKYPRTWYCVFINYYIHLYSSETLIAKKR